MTMCALLSSLGVADDMTLRSGKVLKDASVVSSGDDFVSVQYTDGVAKVPYRELTDEQQKAHSMTQEEVTARLEKRCLENEARKKQAETARVAAAEEARKMRDSLSEAERHPRYLTGEDVGRLFLLVGDLSKVEAEVISLQWNAQEADRVGLPNDAGIFRTRAAAYQDQVNSIRKKRDEAEQYWKDLEKQYLALKSGTQKQIADLSRQVNQLQGEVRDVADQPKTERIIVTPSWVRPWSYPVPPVIIRPSIPVVPPRPYPPVIRPNMSGPGMGMPSRPLPPRPVPVRPNASFSGGR